MSVDKNFVVKNGLEVATNLFLVDKDAKSVGIASTGPRTKLDVRGGIACTDINVSGVATIATLDASDLGKINATSLNITGFSTLGGVSVDQLSVSGFTTFTDFSVDEISGRNLTITGIATVPVFVGLTSFNNGVTVAGVSTISSLDVTGVSTFQSHVHLGDDDELRFGAGDDFKIYHDPDDARLENSNGDIKFKNSGSYFFFDEDGQETLASFINDGAVNLYYDNSKKLETTGTGVVVTGILTATSFDGAVTGNVTGNATGLSGTPNISCGTGAFSGIVALQSHLTLQDNDKIKLGTGDDFHIYHDGSDNIFQSITSGNISFQVAEGDEIQFAQGGTFEHGVRMVAGGAVELYHNGNKKLNTASGGVTVTGALTATSLVGAVTGNVTGNVTGDSAGTHTGAVDLNGGVLTLDADADTTITADTDDQIDIAFGGNDRITLSTGLIDLKNDGSQSQVRLYCEVSNAHYAALQAPAHGDFSGNITLTLPATTDTLVGKTTTDTLTNKTLTSPSITSPSISSPSFTGDIDIADKIVHTGDTNTAIRFPAGDTFSVETGAIEALRVDSAQRLLIGTNTARAIGGESNPRLQIEGSGGTSNSWVNISRFVDSTGAPSIQFGKSRSNTPGTYTVVQDNDTLGTIAFAGADGTDLANYGAKISAEVDGTPGSNNMPGRIVFSTQQPNNDLAERLRISADGKIRVADGSQLAIGTGNDMLIHHNSLNSIINNGTGDLFLMTSGSGDDVNIQAVDDVSIKVQNGEQAIKCIGDGAVELYHNNSKKLETTSAGVTVTGSIVKSGGTSSQFLMADGSVTTATGSDVSDDSSPQLGGNLDVNGNSIVSASNGNIAITPNGSGKVVIDGLSHPTADGNSGQVLKTDGSGNLAFASVNSLAGAGIQNVSDDSSPQLGGTLTTAGNLITFGDSSSTSDDRLKFGAGNDLQIYHNGSNSYIDNSTGDLYVRGVGDDLYLRAADDIYIQPQGSEAGIAVIGNGAVELSHDGSKKLETTSSGITVTGDVNSTSDINLKKDIEVITNANELVKQLKGVTFTWKENDEKSVGVIAQDVEKILPQLVNGDEGEKSVNYSGIIGLLVEAVKELSARVEELEKTN